MNIRLASASAGAGAALRSAPAGGFCFRGPEAVLRAPAPAGRVTPGRAATLGARLAAAFAGSRAEAVIAGALPFDYAGQDDALWLAACPGAGPLALHPAPPPRCLEITADPPAARFGEAVAQALAVMAAEAQAPQTARTLRKIVLARSLCLRLDAAPDPDALLAALATDPAAMAFRVTLPGGRTLVGATPELLVAKTDAQVRSYPLAGSARRDRDPVRDAAAAAALAASGKDRREHALVVEAILDTLSPFCRQLGTPEGTGLTATRSMWHLGTRIEGVLHDPTIPVPLLAAALHPTPAVCGQPQDRAAALIASLEPRPRDFYAGAVGWCDAAGDGAWHVAIRCAELDGSTARLYAGAGIVPGSDPSAEIAETGAKFGAMLAAFGLPPDAALTLPE